ncbi:porin family protein [Flavobacteriaceae bacterium F08102]|nr:porin family protein [Flavobacteriaceae bacterium F08102]
MKKLKHVALVFAMLIGGLSYAQISVGGGLGFNDGVSAPGLLFKAEFNLMDNIDVSPSFSYFSGSRVAGDKNKSFELDVNGHYKIEVMEELVLYPLGGLNYSSYEKYFNGGVATLGNYKDDGNALGLNIGGGGQWVFSDSLRAFAEIKYVISSFGHAVFGGGVLLQL